MELNLIFSPESITHFKKITTEKSSIRIGVSNSGCSGYKYNLNVENDVKLNEDEKLFKIHQLNFIVNKEHLPYFNNCVVQLKKEGLNQKIIFDNPNTSNHCGCGESFNFK